MKIPIHTGRKGMLYEREKQNQEGINYILLRILSKKLPFEFKYYWLPDKKINAICVVSIEESHIFNTSLSFAAFQSTSLQNIIVENE